MATWYISFKGLPSECLLTRTRASRLDVEEGNSWCAWDVPCVQNDPAGDCLIAELCSRGTQVHRSGA